MVIALDILKNSECENWWKLTAIGLFCIGARKIQVHVTAVLYSYGVLFE